MFNCFTYCWFASIVNYVLPLESSLLRIFLSLVSDWLVYNTFTDDLQLDATFLTEYGCQILMLHFTLTKVVTPLKNIKIVWRMGGLIQTMSTGGGLHGIVRCQGSIQKSFSGWWGISQWPSLVIQSRVIMSSHCFAFSHRWLLWNSVISILFEAVAELYIIY